MADKLRLSVIIPHLNAPEALDRCLGALDADRAGRQDVEIIVVDNGSAALPEAVCARHDGVRLAQEATKGPGPARSHGAHLAGAPVLGFIDCDCIAAPGWIGGILAYLDAHPETGAIGGDVGIHLVDPARITPVEAYESVYGYRMQLYIDRDGYAATCNMAVRREVFLQVGDFAGIEIAEDVDWGRRATAMGIRIDYVPQVKITTPARASFQELTRKWDRHIGHDYAEVSGLAGRLRWLARALALAGSPLAEIARIARSPRLSGLRARAKAFGCLTRIRLYRARRMLGLLRRGAGRDAAGAWRGEG